MIARPVIGGLNYDYRLVATWLLTWMTHGSVIVNIAHGTAR